MHRTLLAKIDETLLACFSNPLAFDLIESEQSTAEVLKAEARFPNNIPDFDGAGFLRDLAIRGSTWDSNVLRGSIDGQKIELTMLTRSK